jgi:flagellin
LSLKFFRAIRFSGQNDENRFSHEAALQRAAKRPRRTVRSGVTDDPAEIFPKYKEVKSMGMVVRSNIMALNANRQLGINNGSVAKSLEKLSSGFKINRAGDDASGLAISEKMKAQIKGLETASANAQDGISLVQTAEGALTEVHAMLNRMVELATKSANGTIQDDVDREALQAEIVSLRSEVDRIAQSSNFNGINLLDGSLGTLSGSPKVTAATIGGVDASITSTPAAAAEYTSGAVLAAGGVATQTMTVTYNDENGTEKTIDGCRLYERSCGRWKRHGHD